MAKYYLLYFVYILKSAVAEKLKIVIQVAARYAELLAQPLNGVCAVFGEQLQQIQFAFKFVVSHKFFINVIICGISVVACRCVSLPLHTS